MDRDDADDAALTQKLAELEAALATRHARLAGERGATLAPIVDEAAQLQAELEEKEARLARLTAATRALRDFSHVALIVPLSIGGFVVGLVALRSATLLAGLAVACALAALAGWWRAQRLS